MRSDHLAAITGYGCAGLSGVSVLCLTVGPDAWAPAADIAGVVTMVISSGCLFVAGRLVPTHVDVFDEAEKTAYKKATFWPQIAAAVAAVTALVIWFLPLAVGYFVAAVVLAAAAWVWVTARTVRHSGSHEVTIWGTPVEKVTA